MKTVDADFEKVAIATTLFNRCTLAELIAIKNMVRNGTLRQFLFKRPKSQPEQKETETKENEDRESEINI